MLHLIKVVLVFSVLFQSFCFQSLADSYSGEEGGVSFPRIADYACSNGVKDSYGWIKSQDGFDALSGTLVLQERLSVVGEKSHFSSSYWKVGPLESNSSFSIYLPVGQHFYESKFSYESADCPENLVSNGRKVWFACRSVHVVEDWSCGSLGCSYFLTIFEGKSSDFSVSEYCRFSE